MKDNLDTLKYPIGKFNCPEKITSDTLDKWICELEQIASSIKATYKELDKNKLDKSYREDGWTVRQLIHHIFDSHVNGYIRTKLALTEDTPAIKPYDENAWSNLNDVKLVPLEISIELIDGLHKRWAAVFRSMKAEDFKKEFYHPEHKRKIPLDEFLGSYVWHGKHHLAQIQSVKKSNY